MTFIVKVQEEGCEWNHFQFTFLDAEKAMEFVKMTVESVNPNWKRIKVTIDVVNMDDLIMKEETADDDFLN